MRYDAATQGPQILEGGLRLGLIQQDRFPLRALLEGQQAVQSARDFISILGRERFHTLQECKSAPVGGPGALFTQCCNSQSVDGEDCGLDR